MVTKTRNRKRVVSSRTSHRKRIEYLIKQTPTNSKGVASEIEISAHWAKYVCVLISGFIEQSIKEMLFEYASETTEQRVLKYIQSTWNESKNMKCDPIKEILTSFDELWGNNFETWLDKDERKKQINEIISWRNRIAHGEEANTTNVTLVSVTEKFKIACDLVDFIEESIWAEAA